MVSIKVDHSQLPTEAPIRDTGRVPDTSPRFAHLLADAWAARDRAAGDRPRAHSDARFRHSDAGACARAVAYAALGVEPSDPMDLSGTWNTSLGTLVHDAWQAVVHERWPDARIEATVRSCDGQGAGHIDAVIVDDDLTVSYELKTVGGFAFKMAVGERSAAQGPKWEHITQAALNAKAVAADEAVIGYLAKEALSVQVARRKGFTEFGRFTAEWTFTRDEFLPYAAAEEARIAGILDLLDRGILPARKIPNPDMPSGAVIVKPATGAWQATDADGSMADAGSWWACDYCRWQTACASTKPGRQPVAEVAVRLGLEAVAS